MGGMTAVSATAGPIRFGVYMAALGGSLPAGRARPCSPETLGLWTVSGRSDCPPTGRSNTRILDESIARGALAPALAAMAEEDSYSEVGMADLLAGRPCRSSTRSTVPSCAR